MVNANHEEPRWYFYLGWVVLTFTAVLLAWYAAWALISLAVELIGGTLEVNGQTRTTEDFLFLYMFFPTIGLFAGFFQYTLLRRFLPRMAWWIAATFLGWLIPFVTGYLSIMLLERRNDTFSIMLGLLMIGATIAIPQWWLLRKRVRNASWWILACGLGWGLTGLLSLVTDDEPFTVILALALIPSITTALAWWLFLDWLPGQEEKKNLLFDG